jgi:hypothetical protein
MAAHNGLVAGSSPAGPPIESIDYETFIRRQLRRHTRNARSLLVAVVRSNVAASFLPSLSQVVHFEFAVPFLVKVFTDEAPVAVMRRVFGAEETRTVQHPWIEALLDLAFRH